MWFFRLALLGAIGGACPTPGAAQWRVGLEIGGERLGGVSASVRPPDRSLKPYQPVWWGLRVETPGHRARVAASVRYAAPDLALEAEDATIVAHSALTRVLGFTPEVLVRLAALAPGVGLGGSAGLVVERWDFTDHPARWRAGAQAGVALEAGMGGRVIGRLGAYAGVTPVSPLEAGDLPDGIEPRSAWRLGLRGSLLVGLGR